MYTFRLDLQSPSQLLAHTWEFCVGSCHAYTALRADWREMLLQCHRDLGFRYLRFHGLFNDDMSVVQKSVFSDSYTYSFVNIDNIFDFLLSIGMKPFVELGFMPQAFASKDTTIFHYKGNTSPPKDYALWCDLVQKFTAHMIERYGLAEVRSWYFEVWNEPNLGGSGSPFGFWSGDMEGYFRLYRCTAETLKQCDRHLRVGGPATSNNAWIPEFLDFCSRTGAPVDFVSTHHYPTDVVLGYGVEDSANFVNPLNINDAKQVAHVMELAQAGGAEFDAFKERYSVFQSHLWEHVDRGVLTDMEKKAASQARGLPLYYTEWGSLAGLASDGTFGASFIVKSVLDGLGLYDGCSFWTFCDIVEEDAQNASEFHGGFGLMTQHGIPKAPYRAFELLHRLQGEIYQTVYRGKTVDVYAVSNKKRAMVQLVAVNHHSLLHEIKEETIEIRLQNGGQCCRAERFTVDDTHANALAVWQKNGAKTYLSPGEIQMLQGVSCLSMDSMPFTVQNGETVLRLTLLPMASTLVNVYFR